MKSKNTKAGKTTKKIVRAGASGGRKGFVAIEVPTRLANKVDSFLGTGGNINKFTIGMLKGVLTGANA